MRAGGIVAEFIHAIEARDLDAALELVADDVVYDNVPIGVVTGRDAVRGILEPLVGAATTVEWQIVRQLEHDGVVMNERLDRFQLGDRWIELPVTGIFEVREGRISLWRDYFDLKTFNDQLQG